MMTKTEVTREKGMIASPDLSESKPLTYADIRCDSYGRDDVRSLLGRTGEEGSLPA